MPIAYSNSPIVNSTLPADNAANFITALEDQLLAAGWTLVRHVTGGFVYLMTSPDTAAYKARLLVQDDVNYKIDHPAVSLYNFHGPVLQVMNVAETVVSFPYQLLSNGTYPGFQTVIGRAQAFISEPGNDGGGWSSWACGIPAIPTASGPCVAGLTPPVITDIWWSCGGSQWAFDFRSQATCYACMCYYLNGVIVIAPDDNTISPDSGYLTLFPLADFNNPFGTDQIAWPAITYSAHTVLNIDAFLGWGWNLRGQLWDAFLQTAATTLDQVQTFEDTDSSGNPFDVECITWHSQFYSSLQLITGVVSTNTGNQAY
jgi:hypothetical protein